MKSDIHIDQIRKLPHTNCEDVQDRVFPLHPLLDENGNWNLWVPQNGELVKIQAIPVESNYFAKSPEKPEDIIFPFLEFLEKHALWKDIYPLVTAITSDIHNLAASMEKIEIFLETNRVAKQDVRRMVGTELEYIFITCRSLFDLLQKIIKTLWRRITKLTPNLQEHNLPDSFREMVLKDNKILSSNEIANRRKIPQDLAVFYNSNAKFFEWLREYRDRITHKDGEFDLIFIDTKGFAIMHDKPPFNDMPIWSDSNCLPNNLGSVKSATSYIISSTLKAFDNALEFFKNRIKFPPDVVPNYRMYTRGINNKHLLNLETNISKF